MSQEKNTRPSWESRTLQALESLAGRRGRYGAAIATVLAMLGGICLSWPRGADPAEHVPAIDTSLLEPAAARVVVEARGAVVTAPSSAVMWGRFGSALWAQNFIADADQCYARAEQLDPRDVRWPYLRGLVLQSQDPDRSLSCLCRATQIRGDLALPRVVLAEMLTNRGELAEADQQLRAAVALAPLDSRVLVALARSALLSGRLADAAHWATEAARLDPTRASIHRLLCQIHQRRGDQAKVDEELRILAKLTAPVAYYEWPDPFLAEVAQYKRDSASVLQMAQRLIEDGDAADAIARLQEAGGVRAADVRIAILLGKAYVHANDLRRAADTLQRARARDPRQAPVHFELGNLARTEHRLEEAAAHYAEAARLEPNYALAHYQLGLCRRELGDRDGAISAIEQACQCVPQSARVRHLLVQLLWESDRRQEATEHLQQAIRLAPNDPETRRLQDQMRQP